MVLNIPIKRQRLSHRIILKDPTLYNLQKMYLQYEDTNRLHIKGCKNVDHSDQKEVDGKYVKKLEPP